MEPFKNLISEDVVTLTGLHLGKALPHLDKDAFVASILPHLGKLELKQRVQFISEKMLAVLPSNVRERNKILVAMLHPDKFDQAVKPSTQEGMCGWGVWPLTDVIGRSGLDDFEVTALKRLSENPTKAFSRIETLNGTQVLRYAQADVLGESCVGCHNTYTGTQKSDWKVGDVRGVLEITRPLASFESAAQASLKKSFLIMLSVILCMVALLFTVLKRLRNSKLSDD